MFCLWLTYCNEAKQTSVVLVYNSKSNWSLLKISIKSNGAVSNWSPESKIRMGMLTSWLCPEFLFHYAFRVSICILITSQSRKPRRPILTWHLWFYVTPSKEWEVRPFLQVCLRRILKCSSQPKKMYLRI